jgi:hypothetical protein
MLYNRAKVRFRIMEQLIQVMEDRYQDLIDSISKDIELAKSSQDEPKIRGLNTLLLRLYDEYLDQRIYHGQ